MAEELICPKCNKPSYTAAPYDPTPCPYCGFVFSKIMRKDDEGYTQEDSGAVKR